MDNRCPKCGEKLSIFYIKENCPKCGANILYYNMEERLEEDAVKAQAEYEKAQALVDKITPKFVKKILDKKKNAGEETAQKEETNE